ncbi:hypothetical protein [Methanocella arvoryzae]|uniref:Lipocalin-like domain-containing protein n=1 Tax=Methanocella arvoryzae (strain DSM 22066 / NBRC 105507 / MRE50) TaxID=351160 RepID=Q0W721_METAR|nr:hypothetical protein [Methanocella arvoryzae]CAJ35822.1 hypothetical protein RCIX378 [Methanocella arvoryzae MRE50]
MKPISGLLLLQLILMAVTLAGCCGPINSVNYSGDPVIGTWNWMSPGGSAGIEASYTFAADGTFTRTYKEGSVVETHSGTWSKTDTNTYALVYKGKNPGFDSENLYYLNQTGRLRNDSNDFFKKAA